MIEANTPAKYRPETKIEPLILRMGRADLSHRGAPVVSQLKANPKERILKSAGCSPEPLNLLTLNLERLNR